MEIDLTLYFVGECLFVPDPDGQVTGTKAMYVLLPVVPAMPHVAMLCVYNTYIPGGPPWTLVSMERSVLTLGGSPSFSTDMPGSIADVGFVANAAINTETLGSDPEGRLNARVELTSGERGPSSTGALWHYPQPGSPGGGSQEIVYVTSWVFSQRKIPGNTLELTFTPLGNGTAPPPLILTPNDGKIEAWLFATPTGDLPNANTPEDPIAIPLTFPKLGTPAPHFAAYYGLFKDPRTVTLVPTFSGTFEQGGSPFTCLTAGSQLTPP